MENVLSILFCLSLFYVPVTSRVKAYVTILQVQGVILSVVMIIPFLNHFSVFGIILPATLILVKVFLIPRYINKIILDLDIKRRIEPTIQQMTFLLLVIASMTVIFLASNVLSKNTELEAIPFASGFSAIIVGIYIIMFRKKLIVHVCGFLILENGIFNLISTISSTPFLPMIQGTPTQISF